MERVCFLALTDQKHERRTAMNKKSKLMMIGIATIMFSLMAILPAPNQVMAEETRIVRFYAQLSAGVTTRIEPKNVWVRPGTIIVFNNWAGDEVSITFKEGQKCDEATQSSAGFEYDPKTQCVVTTQYVPYGGTASMMFKDAGRFDYEIELVEKKVKDKGSITVRPRTE
jgi:hypothetical protein